MSVQPCALRVAHRVVAIALLFATCAAASVVLAQPGGAPGDWPMYSRDLAGTRYSPLTRSRGATSAGSSKRGPCPSRARPTTTTKRRVPSGNPQATPIVVDGVMYLPVRGHEVLALDAATGEEIWRTALPTTEGTEARGVGYWPGDGELGARILVMSGPTLVALEAASGAPARGFGRDGVAQVVVPWRGVPLIYGNLAIVGARTGELNQGHRRRYARVRRAHGRARLDLPHRAAAGRGGARDLARPRLAQPLRRQRLGLLHDARRGERQRLYMPVSSAAGNYWGGDRPGSNLFSNSIVAVDALDGRVPLALPDRAPRSLGFRHAEPARARRHRARGPHACRRSRRSARRPTCSSSIATTGEPDLRRRGASRADRQRARRVVLADAAVSREAGRARGARHVRPRARHGASRRHDAAARRGVRGALGAQRRVRQRRGPTRRSCFHEDGAPPRSTLQLPGRAAAASTGAAWRPIPRAACCSFTQTIRRSSAGSKRRRPARTTATARKARRFRTIAAASTGPGPYFSFSAPVMNEAGERVGSLPCYRPPWSRLIAIDASSGEVAWETTLGISEALPPEKQLTGSTGSAGPSVTAERPRVRRRDERSALPRVRCADGQSALGGHARRQRQRESDDVPRARRQTVRRRRSRRQVRRVRAALKRVAGAVTLLASLLRAQLDARGAPRHSSGRSVGCAPSARPVRSTAVSMADIW